MYILICDGNYTISNELLADITAALKAIESETGMLFDAGTFPKLKLTISNNLGVAGNIGAYMGEDGNIYFANTSYINIIPDNPFIIYHEAMHSIRYRNSCWSISSTFEEGLADYIAKKLLIQYEFRPADDSSAIYVFYASMIPEIKDIAEKIEGFFNYNESTLLSESGGMMRYYAGEMYFTYLEHHYGSIKKSVYNIVDNAAEALKTLYGDDVFLGFDSWLESNSATIKNLPLR